MSPFFWLISKQVRSIIAFVEVVPVFYRCETDHLCFKSDVFIKSQIIIGNGRLKSVDWT